MNAEAWRTVPGFEDYSVSDRGQVVSHKTRKPQPLKPWIDKDGYRWVALYREGKRCGRTVHSLVAEAFLGPRPEVGFQVRHLNGNPAENTPANLCWGSGTQNRLDSVRHGTHRNARKTHCSRNHPYDDTNTYRVNGRRRCRRCCAEASAAWYARKRAERAA